MKTSLLIGLATLLSSLPSSADPASGTHADRPVPITGRITLAPEDLSAIALDKPIEVAAGLRITHMGVGRFDQAPSTSDPISAPDLPTPRPALSFVPASEIPFEPGQYFGWVIRFDSNRDSVTLTEEFVLPSPITISGGSGSTIISRDGKTATTPRDFPYLWDWTYNFWGLEEGDPVGDHEFGVFLGETEVARFKFKIIEP